MRTTPVNQQDSLLRTSEEIAECVEIFRWELYNRAEPCGAAAIRQRLDEEIVRPLPLVSTIGRILRRRGLVQEAPGRS